MTTASPAASDVPHPGFAAALASEWVKIRSIRATYVQVVLAIVLALGMTGLVSLAIGSTFDELSVEDQATFDPVTTSYIGATFGLIVVIVLGVTFVSSEYTSGMIRLTLTATPQRIRILAAKAVIVTAICLVLGGIAAFGSFFIGQAVLGSYEGVPTATLEGEALRSVVAVWLTSPMFPLIGAALGAILRSTASAITTVLSILFVPGILGALLPDVLERNVMRYLPGNASDQLILVDKDPGSALYLDFDQAAVLVILWLAAFGVAACYLIMRRDV